MPTATPPPFNQPNNVPVHTVKHGGHEDARTAVRAGLAQALHLASILDLVKLQHPELDLLVLVLLLLGLGVGLLLALLTTTKQAEQHIEGLLIRHTSLRQQAGIVQQLAAKGNGLLVTGETCVVLVGVWCCVRA